MKNIRTPNVATNGIGSAPPKFLAAFDSHETTGSPTQPSRARPPTHRVTVTGVEVVTPHMRRITFEGETLAGLDVPLPAQWLKVVVPNSASGSQENRAYSIRSFFPGWRTMEVDFVLHGDTGPVSSWAKRAEVGDVVHLGSPRGGYRVNPDARWRLLAGDETALPAIASILKATREGETPTSVAIEVPDIQDEQSLSMSCGTEVHWLPRDRYRASPGDLLKAWVMRFAIPQEPGQVFLAGEAATVRAMKGEIAHRASQAMIDAKGYWLMGQANHRDSAER
ncbi:MAG: siderophore-interacting protein [Janthinobacterium lividum]